MDLKIKEDVIGMNDFQCADFSVLISIYKDDNPRYFREALESIYDSQLLKPDEIVLVADGMINDEHLTIIDSFINKYPDILQFYPLEKNQGLASALNFGLRKCKHDLIVRMDSDDISLPDRFSTQYKFMMENMSISVCGSYIEEVDPDTLNFICIRKVPIVTNEISKFAKRRSPVSHPSVIFRKSVVLQYGGYPPFRKSQDYALWSNLLKEGIMFANLPEVLLKMRTGQELQNRRGFSHFKYEFAVLKYQYKIGFISIFDFALNFGIRFFLRATPVWVRKFLYSMR